MIDFPEIAERPLVVAEVVDTPPVSTAVALATLRTTALSELSAVEKGIAQLRADHGSTNYDITTPKGYKLATARRHAIREVRYKVPHVVKDRKAALKEIAEAVASEGERIIAVLKAIEDPHDEKILAEDKRKADEKAERERKEAERIAAHQERLDVLRGYVDLAKGQPSARIEAGIAAVEAIDIDPEAWEEFFDRAVAAKADTIVALREMKDAAKGAEDAKAEADRVRAENEKRSRIIAALSNIQREAMGCMGKPSEYIAERIAVMDITVYSEELGEDIVTAHEAALVQLHELLKQTKRTEENERELAAARDRESFSQRVQAALAEPVLVTAEPPVVRVSAEAPAEPPLYAPLRDVSPAPAEPKRVITVELDDTPPAEIPPAPPAPTLKLGDIQVRLAPVLVTLAGLASLGFTPSGRAGAAMLFHEEQFAPICDAISAHVLARKAA